MLYKGYENNKLYVVGEFFSPTIINMSLTIIQCPIHVVRVILYFAEVYDNNYNLWIHQYAFSRGSEESP